MMPYKFRGMDLQGRWHYGNLAILTEDLSPSKKGSYISNSVGVPFAYSVRPETVSQFTGIYDKKGNEIYGGDILAFGRMRYQRNQSDEHQDAEGRYVKDSPIKLRVEWSAADSGSMVGYLLSHHDHYHSDGFLTAAKGRKSVICGNIHEV